MYSDILLTMPYFSNKDPLWEEAAQFVDQQMNSDSLTLGPTSFVNVLANVLSYHLLNDLDHDLFDFVIVHKGECLLIGKKNLETWEKHYSAIFANAVFIVFSKKATHQIDRLGNDFKSLIDQFEKLPDEPLIEKHYLEELEKQDNLDYTEVITFIQSI